jgi:hypothetical protein
MLEPACPVAPTTAMFMPVAFEISGARTGRVRD